MCNWYFLLALSIQKKQKHETYLFLHYSRILITYFSRKHKWEFDVFDSVFMSRGIVIPGHVRALAFHRVSHCFMGGVGEVIMD